MCEGVIGSIIHTKVVLYNIVREGERERTQEVIGLDTRDWEDTTSGEGGGEEEKERNNHNSQRQ